MGYGLGKVQRRLAWVGELCDDGGGTDSSCWWKWELGRKGRQNLAILLLYRDFVLPLSRSHREAFFQFELQW